MSNAGDSNSKTDDDRARFMHLLQEAVQVEEESENRLWMQTQSHEDQLPSFGFTNSDVVLVAIPMTDERWFSLFEASVASGAHIILPGSEIEPGHIAKTIREEGVTVLATTSGVWTHVANHLKTTRGYLTQMRTVIFGGLATLEHRTRLILTPGRNCAQGARTGSQPTALGSRNGMGRNDHIC